MLWKMCPKCEYSRCLCRCLMSFTCSAVTGRQVATQHLHHPVLSQADRWRHNTYTTQCCHRQTGGGTIPTSPSAVTGRQVAAQYLHCPVFISKRMLFFSTTNALLFDIFRSANYDKWIIVPVKQWKGKFISFFGPLVLSPVWPIGCWEVSIR